MLDFMTLEEKVYQLFYVTPEILTGKDPVTLAGDATKTALESYPVGGLVYFSQNLVDREQTVNLLDNTQGYSKIPLFLGVDEEGGTVSRIGSNPALGGTAVDSMELEYAMEYLLQRLDAAGIADRTVIVLTNDHYPYGLTEEEYNELAGKQVDTTFEKYRNSFICYVPGMSKTICQILADVLRREVETIEDPRHVGTLGAAALAAVSLGVLDDIKDIRKIIRVGARFTPNPENAAVYDRIYPVFKSLYRNNQKAFAALNGAVIRETKLRK